MADVKEEKRVEKKQGNKKAPVSMRQLLESGVHFGHQTRRWNPKMKPFIFLQLSQTPFFCSGLLTLW